MFGFDAGQSDEHGAEHGEHHRLNEAYQTLQAHHEDTHEYTECAHAQLHSNDFSRNEEDDTCNGNGYGVSSHHVSEETDHECEGLGENTHELDDGNDGYRCFQPCWHIRPEDILPIMLIAAELHDDEGAESKEECHGDVTGHVAPTRWEGHQTHHVACEDEEEAGEQVGRIFFVAFSHSRSFMNAATSRKAVSVWYKVSFSAPNASQARRR